MFNQSIAVNQNINFFTNQRRLFLFILMLMSVAGLVGSDVYLPALPVMGKVFAQTPQSMQFTLGIYLVGLSIGQLIMGPLTDSLGRKKLLIVGMAIYLLASLSCAASLTYTQLLASRLLQALGACSGLVIGRAIVGDVYEAKESGKIFATIFPFVGMSPAISPFIGGFISYYFGWQATFVFVSIFAASIIVLSLIYLPETLDESRKVSLHPFKILAAYPKVLIDKKFITYASAPCIAYFAYFAYIAQSPFIFHAHGFGEREIGSFYISLSLTYVVGNLTGKRLLHFFSLDRVLMFGFIIFNLGGLMLFISSLANLSLLALVLSFSVLTFGNGFLIPLGTAGVVSNFSKTTGYASGLLGFIQLGVAAISTALVGQLSHNNVIYLAIYIFISTLFGLLVFSLLNSSKRVVQC